MGPCGAKNQKMVLTIVVQDVILYSKMNCQHTLMYRFYQTKKWKKVERFLFAKICSIWNASRFLKSKQYFDIHSCFFLCWVYFQFKRFLFDLSLFTYQVSKSTRSLPNISNTNILKTNIIHLHLSKFQSALFQILAKLCWFFTVSDL